MIEQLVLFFLQDALFLLGYLSRGNAFPKPLAREEEARLIAQMAQGDAEARGKLIFCLSWNGHFLLSQIGYGGC